MKYIWMPVGRDEASSLPRLLIDLMRNEEPEDKTVELRVDGKVFQYDYVLYQHNEDTIERVGESTT